MKVLIAGDYSPKYRLEQYLANKDFEFIFGNVRNLISNSDLSIINFESVVKHPNQKEIRKAGSCLSCPKEAMEALKWAGFDVITLANNHCLDYGMPGLKKTISLANEYGIQTVGAGETLEQATAVLYQKINNQYVAIINCCEHEFSVATEDHGGANPLDLINQYKAINEARKKADYVLVIVHGGHEHFQLPRLAMQDTYRHFIDLGADAVINHHQHCYSGYEIYGGKPIFYGLGNFCFDEKTHVNPETWIYGYLVELTFDRQEGDSFKIIPYAQCAEQPKVQLLEDRQKFNKQISELNSVISDRRCLKEELEKYYIQSSRSSLSLFEPYSNRITKALFSRKILPSRISSNKALMILNRIECESHLDKLRYAAAKKSGV